MTPSEQKWQIFITWNPIEGPATPDETIENGCRRVAEFLRKHRRQDRSKTALACLVMSNEPDDKGRIYPLTLEEFCKQRKYKDPVWVQYCPTHADDGRTLVHSYSVRTYKNFWLGDEHTVLFEGSQIAVIQHILETYRFDAKLLFQLLDQVTDRVNALRNS